MTVPMSPEEFSYKRDAILKHQSQIHDAPFRDPENGKLSWQRSIDRNKATADLYSSLGLASYEAMEAFVQFKLPQDEE
jgi:glucosamine-6-phosphate deaminase